MRFHSKQAFHVFRIGIGSPMLTKCIAHIDHRGVGDLFGTQTLAPRRCFGDSRACCFFTFGENAIFLDFGAR